MKLLLFWTLAETWEKRPQPKSLIASFYIDFFMLWLSPGFLTSLVALVASIFRRKAPLGAELSLVESTIAVWPPLVPLTTWHNRLLVAPWYRWDAEYFVWSVSGGFRTNDGTPLFHPLFSLLARPLIYAGVYRLLSLLVASNLATLPLYLAFYRLARLDLDDDLLFRRILYWSVKG